ncbi:MAG: hypothetical protein LBU62_06575 [Bacteroidales bacterium]|nr:hypothetical protein [Bacteroidales bacterium]
MTENSLEQEMQVDAFQLYSQRAIGVATFLGGPLAAGILARHNFIRLGQPQWGKYALIIGIISTVLVFAGVCSLPEEMLDKIPKILIPSIYTLIIGYIVKIYQGAALKAHKANNRPFCSVWKAAGVGILCTAIYLAIVLGAACLAPSVEMDVYDAGIEKIFNNEDKAMQIYSFPEEDSIQVISHIDSVAMPAWNENLTILAHLDKIEGLPEVCKKQNELLLQYTKLRIVSFQLIRKAVAENSSEYNAQMDTVNFQLDEIVEKHKSISE